VLICTDGTFGGRYRDQLAAQHSCQKELENPLTVMELFCFGTGCLWYVNGIVNGNLVLIKTNNVTCPCRYIDDVLSSSDLWALSDGVRLLTGFQR